MILFLRLLAVLLALTIIGIWAALGAHTGWSQTKVPVTKVDPITTIEYTEYEERFVPGLDFLGAGLIVAGALGGVSWGLQRFKRKKTPMKTTILTLALTTSLLPLLHAEPQTFDFKDPKGVNNAVFKLDAPLESINGTASGISGTVKIDWEKPEEATGTITVETESMTVPNPVMQEHLHAEDWMHVEKHETITFELKELSNVKKEGNKGTADATGTFTMKGQSKEVTVPVTVTYLPGKLADRSNGKMEGDLLVIRTDFKVNRSEFGIQPGKNTDKVAEEVEISLAIAGAAPKE